MVFTETGTIRVEIDDFDDLHICDELKKPIEIGGVEWTFGVFSETSARTNNVRHLGAVLHCNKASRSNLWEVNASVKFKLCKSGAADLGATSEIFEFKFSSCQKTLEVPNFMNWQEATSVENGYVSDNTAVMEAHVQVNQVKGYHVENKKKTFEEPEEHLADVILILEEKKLHVGKQFLAQHSKFFNNLFSDPKTEFLLDDVNHTDFVEFLNLIYRTCQSIDNKNVDYILKLADRFETPFVIEECERFLIKSNDIHIVDKLKYAEIYKLSALQDHCLSQLKTSQEVLDLAKHERHKSLGAVTSEALFQKIAEISKNQSDC